MPVNIVACNGVDVFEEVERQLDEYRAVTAVQTSQLQNTIATLQQQVKCKLSLIHILLLPIYLI